MRILLQGAHRAGQTGRDKPAQWYIPLFRRLAVATAVFPLKSLYVGLYRGLIWSVARWLAKDPAVKAVYLINGCARGEIVPGISDIDLSVISEEGGPPNVHRDLEVARRIKERYKRLSRHLPVLEGGVGVFAAVRLEEFGTRSIQQRYIFMEMKHNGGLLWGPDYIGQRVPELSEPMLRSALLGRIEMRWFLFVGNFVGKNAVDRDLMMCNSVCYRLCTDVLKIALDVEQGTMTFKRQGVLARALSLVEGEDQAFVQMLMQLERRRFLPRTEGVVEKSLGFLLRQYDAFYQRLVDHPYGRPCKEVTHHIDHLEAEDFTPKADGQLVEALLAHVEENWAESLLGVYLVPSVFFDLDDRLLLLQVDVDRLPTLAQLAALRQVHLPLQEKVERQVHTLLLLPHMACCVHPVNFRTYERHKILPQAFVSDVSMLLHRPEYALRGGNYKVWAQPHLTVYSAFFFWSQRLQYRQYIEEWQPGVDAPLVMVRQWWRWLQLELVHRGIEAGAVDYALTLPAIGRGLERIGMELPTCFEAMQRAYRSGVAGQDLAADVGLDQAREYAQQVAPQGHISSRPPPWLS